MGLMSDWKTLQKVFKKQFGSELDHEAVLFLIGIQELGMVKTKFKKQFKGIIKGKTNRGSKIIYGNFALKSIEIGRITSKQIEAGRRAIVRQDRPHIAAEIQFLGAGIGGDRERTQAAHHGGESHETQTLGEPAAHRQVLQNRVGNSSRPN